MTYQCFDNEVLQIPTTKKSAMVMIVSKKFLTNHLLKFPSNGEGYHKASWLLEIVMDKFSILASLNCHEFISGSKRFVRS